MATDTTVLTVDLPTTTDLGQGSCSRGVEPPSRKPRHRPRSQVFGLACLLVVTAMTYLWNLTSSGDANSFYAAAVQAGTKSWKAFFFGSLDSSNFITVDKPPASLWIMELSGRILGFGSFSMLLPQVLEGVVTVALLYAVIRRWYGHRAGLLAGALVAVTPVAALMFRFNNPDALLVMLMTAGAYGTTRATEKANSRWLMVAGTALGFAFLAKMGQALLVVPGFGLAYLVAAPTSLRGRALHLLAGAGAMIVAAGWWVLIVSLWPAGSRPMIDGSSTNSIWNLIVGYNGLDRVVSSGSSGGGGNFSGATGFFRLFNSLMGGQASWLLPVAVASLLGGLALTRRAPRTDRTRASLIMWGGWLAVTAFVFSYGEGIIHTYYTVALVPAIAALTAIGAAQLAGRWSESWTRWTAAGGVAITAGWAVILLDRTPSWNPWLRSVIIVSAVLAVAGLVASTGGRGRGRRRTLAGCALAAALVACLAGPLAYTADTIGTAHTGSIVSAGPTLTAASQGGPGGGSRPSGQGGRAFPAGWAGQSGTGDSAGQSTPALPGESSAAAGSSQDRPPGARATTGGSSGAGQTTEVSTGLITALKVDASKYRWVAATSGSQSAATIELATGGDPVMAIGGFSAEGGNITLGQFEKYVAAGDIHYYIAGSSSGGPGGNASTSSAITSWVESHFTSTTIGGETVYDLTSPAT